MARRGKRPQKKHRSLIWLVIALIALLLGLAWLYGPKLNQGVVTCEGDECLEAGHFHAELIVTSCGQKMELEQESGVLSGHHTHKENNRVHWHSTKQPGEDLTVSMLLDNLNIILPEECDGSPAKVNVLINGNPADPSRSWHDGDTIVVSVE